MVDLLLGVVELPELPEMLDDVVLTHRPVTDLPPVLIVVHHQLEGNIVNWVIIIHCTSNHT